MDKKIEFINKISYGQEKKTVDYAIENSDEGSIFEENNEVKETQKESPDTSLFDFSASVYNGLKYTYGKSKILDNEISGVYEKAIGNDKLTDFLLDIVKYSQDEGHFLDLNVNINEDLTPLLNNEKAQTFINNITKYSDFMHTEEYKNYLAEEDTLVKEDKNTILNCLDICDYMNMEDVLTNDSVIFGENSPWEEVEASVNNDSGFMGKVYVNKETKEIIIGFCGTNNIKDITSDDLDMVMTEVPDQYEDALNLYKKYADNEEYKDYNFTVTGHSLGGSLSQLLAASEDVSASGKKPKVITFNAFGTYNIINNNENKNYNFSDTKNIDESNIYNYITEGDFVSCTSRQIGKTTLVDNISPFGHMTASIHTYLENT